MNIYKENPTKLCIFLWSRYINLKQEDTSGHLIHETNTSAILNIVLISAFTTWVKRGVLVSISF